MKELKVCKNCGRKKIGSGTTKLEDLLGYVGMERLTWGMLDMLGL
jgi:hypothetical protein